MRTSPLKFLALILIVVVVSSCASTSRPPLETAKLTYADASLVYETTMQGLSDLRAAHKITDTQWKEIDYLQGKVQSNQPAVRAALNLWQATGQEPAAYAKASKEVADAIAFLSAILSGVK